LLEAAGVDKVAKLWKRVPDNFRQKMPEVNGSEKIAKSGPILPQVKSWIVTAEKMPGMIMY